MVSARRVMSSVGRCVRPLQQEDGQGLVELALAVVVLLAILFGTIEYAFAWNRKNDAVHLANEAARFAAVGKTDWCTTVQNEAAANGIHSGVVNLATNPDTQIGSTIQATVTGVPVANLVPNLVPGVPSSVQATASMRLEQPFTLSPTTCAFT